MRARKKTGVSAWWWKLD